jgi:hypothetical protein
MTTTHDIFSKFLELQHVLQRCGEQFHEMNEMDELLHESHLARVGYMRSLSKERIRQERKIQREQRREEKLKLREQNRLEKKQRRLEREAEILRYTIEQRDTIRKQARLFRQMKRDEEEQARMKEIEEGWKTVTYKRTKKQNNKSKY